MVVLEYEICNFKSFKDKLWDKIIGGKWIWFLLVKYGCMLKLVKINYDYFFFYVKEVYLMGYKLVMDKVREVSDKMNVEEKENLLYEVLLLDGFVCYFLIDSFLSGYIWYKLLILLLLL